VQVLLQQAQAGEVLCRIGANLVYVSWSNCYESLCGSSASGKGAANRAWRCNLRAKDQDQHDHSRQVESKRRGHNQRAANARRGPIRLIRQANLFKIDVDGFELPNFRSIARNYNGSYREQYCSRIISGWRRRNARLAHSCRATRYSAWTKGR
jgi:hypothetical protein